MPVSHAGGIGGDVVSDDEQLEEAGFTFEITCPSVPTQAEGMISGRPWYFRYRHGRFTLTVGPATAMDELGDWVLSEPPISWGVIGGRYDGSLYEETVRDIVKTALRTWVVHPDDLLAYPNGATL